MFSPSYMILSCQRLDIAISVDLDEAAHYELPHLDLHCLQIKTKIISGALTVYSYLR